MIYKLFLIQNLNYCCVQDVINIIKITWFNLFKRVKIMPPSLDEWNNGYVKMQFYNYKKSTAYMFKNNIRYEQHYCIIPGQSQMTMYKLIHGILYYSINYEICLKIKLFKFNPPPIDIYYNNKVKNVNTVIPFYIFY
jgi:hypothetical protein